MEPDGAGDVWSAGLKSIWCLFPGALLVINSKDHLAAALIWWRHIQPLSTPVKNAEPSWTAHFVARKRHEIAPDLLHVQGPMAGALCGINQSYDSFLARLLADL